MGVEGVDRNAAADSDGLWRRGLDPYWSEGVGVNLPGDARRRGARRPVRVACEGMSLVPSWRWEGGVYLAPVGAGGDTWA